MRLAARRMGRHLLSMEISFSKLSVYSYECNYEPEVAQRTGFGQNFA
jgi:hypothetical protein